jgi:alkylation response protein AidB-like acyl-CoA dehydrogenase
VNPAVNGIVTAVRSAAKAEAVPFVGDADLDELRRAVRRFVMAERALPDKEMWQQIVAQGWLQVLETDAGVALRTLTMFNVELGRIARSFPLAEAFWILRAAAAKDAAPELITLAARVRNGEPVTLAVVGQASRLRTQALELHGGRGSARLCNVEYTTLARIIVAVSPERHLALWAEVGAPGITVEENPGYNPHPLADVIMRDVSVTACGVGEDAGTAGELLRLAAVARAWGALSQAFETLVEYVKIREQFGRQIGRFQAVQHKLANVRIVLDASRLLMGRAAAAFDGNAQQWKFHVACACAYSMRALRLASLEVHHLFGAVGFMEEHPMPALFRQIHADTARHGGCDQALEDVAAYVLRQDGLSYIPVQLGAGAESFRTELRAWLDRHWTEEDRVADGRRDKSERHFDRKFLASLGERNWIGLALPAEAGGAGLGTFEQYVFTEELNRRAAPMYGFAMAQLLAPSLLRHGTLEQRRRFLPLMLQGKAVFCLGYSEPNAGSDLASLRTRARRDGDHWVIDGAKTWTTFGTLADYVWLAARTDPEQPRQAGISVFIVPMNAAGITIRPMQAMNGHKPCAVFYDQVRVPLDALVGELNDGWRVITSALAQERVSMGGLAARLSRYLEELAAALQTAPAGAAPFSQRADVRRRFAVLAADGQAASLLSLQATAIAAADGSPALEAAISKVFSSELEERISEEALEIFGIEATFNQGAPAAVLDGQIEHSLPMALMYVIGGGSNEIQRNLIAQGLGLPKS